MRLSNQHLPSTGGIFQVSVTAEDRRVHIATTNRPITAQAGGFSSVRPRRPSG